MEPYGGFDVDSDPRLTGEYVCRVPGECGDVTLVGVVHDHPASVYRVQRVIEESDPKTVALELPPISVPLFEEYAATEREPPLFGGEMSAAIQAASPGTAVGIDRPNSGFFGQLGRKLVQNRPSLETVRKLLSNIRSTTKHALICRVAAVLAACTSIRLEVDSPTAHDIGPMDSPEAQAQDERTQVRRARSFMDAFQTASRSRASRLEDEARESTMADQLATLRKEGDVVAVVGIDHLDPLTERLDTGTEAT